MKIELTNKEGKLLDKAFEIGVLIKAFFGFFEILGGIFLTISGEKIINNFVIFITQQEIINDPNDIIANYLIRLSEDFSFGTQIFAVSYLLFHGIVNIFLAVVLLKDKLWAYPLAIELFCAFLAYQIYKYFHSFSPILLFLIIFDLFVVLIIWLEYKRHRKRIAKKLMSLNI
ncbi:MAG: DUF2127 domain-containing protein [Patescibacteria group bacterium]|mgnify:FL=1